MGALVAAVVIGIIVALVLARVIYIVVARAVDNAIRWAIYTFGNDDAVRRTRAADGLPCEEVQADRPEEDRDPDEEESPP